MKSKIDIDIMIS